MEPDLVMVDAFRVLRDFNGKPRHQATPGDITRKKPRNTGFWWGQQN